MSVEPPTAGLNLLPTGQGASWRPLRRYPRSRSSPSGSAGDDRQQEDRSKNTPGFPSGIGASSSFARSIKWRLTFAKFAHFFTSY